MVVTYRLTADDYVEAQLAHRLRRTHIRWIFRAMNVWMVLLVLLGLVAVAMGSEVQSILAVFVVPIAWFVFANPGWFLRRQFRKIQQLQHENTVMIDEDGTTWSSATGEGKLYWSAIVEVIETKNLLLLYQQPNLFNPIPKRAFGDINLQAFRALLRQRVQGRLALRG